MREAPELVLRSWENTADRRRKQGNRRTGEELWRASRWCPSEGPVHPLRGRQRCCVPCLPAARAQHLSASLLAGHVQGDQGNQGEGDSFCRGPRTPVACFGAADLVTQPCPRMPKIFLATRLRVVYEVAGRNQAQQQKSPRRKPGAHRPRQTQALRKLIRREQEDSMCFYAPIATVSRRRRLPSRQSAPLPPLAVLDLSKPGERQAHDFLCRATGRREGIWNLIGLRRRGDVLLCVVRWLRPRHLPAPYSLAMLSLTEPAVRWWDHATPESARSAMDAHCVAQAGVAARATPAGR